MIASLYAARLGGSTAAAPRHLCMQGSPTNAWRTVGTPAYTGHVDASGPGQSWVEKAASKAAAGGSKASRRTNASASGAPTSRSMPASSHSMEMGPS